MQVRKRGDIFTCGDARALLLKFTNLIMIIIRCERVIGVIMLIFRRFTVLHAHTACARCSKHLILS